MENVSNHKDIFCCISYGYEFFILFAWLKKL